jgi:hypothetical protein
VRAARAGARGVLPFGRGANWLSWTLYTPLAATLFGALYEIPQKGGWRFDLMFFFYPLYALIGAGWLVRMIFLFTRPA